ncbi:hypothetical protein [Methylophaga nitratireducenticrescens]|uniref:hypothetical protein n=1 Tax=Methylophaga nitratireducenticrescens TaxID=754476 RepID=UPI000CDBCE3F|nr:hypothetical protein [Methylophaga nitratireducenticrescens]AUZ83795.1 hypothetical protein CDW43_04060 [Methylophaga nitratireducenticrescens]
MINISSWSSYLAKDLESRNPPNKYSLTFTYTDQYDDRSSWATQYIDMVSEKSITVDYNPLDPSMTIGSEVYSLLHLKNYRVPKGRILVDSTSLALPELLHLFFILEKNKRSFDVMYVQPDEYTESKVDGLKAIQSFDLSDDGTGVQQLPPYVGYSYGSMIFFFLGWEGHRLGSLINSEEFDIKNITCLLGIPPFKPSWDYKTLSSNYRQLADLNNITTPRFKYAGANDPIKTYEMIDQVYKSTTYHNQWLSLAPFGTKPAAIASAQFAVNNTSRLIMLYDFVKKKHKRSNGTDLVHVWKFEYSNEA